MNDFTCPGPAYITIKKGQRKLSCALKIAEDYCSLPSLKDNYLITKLQINCALGFHLQKHLSLKRLLKFLLYILSKESFFLLYKSILMLSSINPHITAHTIRIPPQEWIMSIVLPFPYNKRPTYANAICAALKIPYSLFSIYPLFCRATS